MERRPTVMVADLDGPVLQVVHGEQFLPGGWSAPAAVTETHSGVVFFVGDRAYKLKKPLDLGFLDFRMREARLAACQRELVLNRRLAPDVYLGVADVSGPDGTLLDHLLVMRRMPDDRRLSSLVVGGAPVLGHLDRLADLLARFHRDAERAPWIDDVAGVDAEIARWEANAAAMQRFRGDILDPEILDDVASLCARYLAGRRPLFEQRVKQGRACDGHGDLLADDIFCLDDGPRVLDCLEFDDRLRVGDVLGDVAFLAMDLERLGRADLARHFLDRYRMVSGDSWPESLAHHHIAYRAQVRAKVACLRWAQGDGASRAQAGSLMRLCREHLRGGRVRLVLVGGLPGTGKSTIARGIERPLGAVVLRSDVVRKELEGVEPGSHLAVGLDEGLYGPSSTGATYAELLRRAGRALGLGQSVVLDATWRDAGWRLAASDLARQTSAELAALRCVAPLETAVARVRTRLSTGTDVSDATEQVTRHLARLEAPWACAHDVDTSRDPALGVSAALAALGVTFGPTGGGAQTGS
jgi:aminoglycoside phosphotransferase family enzyme/predicted kinase